MHRMNNVIYDGSGMLDALPNRRRWRRVSRVAWGSSKASGWPALGTFAACDHLADRVKTRPHDDFNAMRRQGTRHEAQ
jgi:hypothetical protein